MFQQTTPKGGLNTRLILHPFMIGTGISENSTTTFIPSFHWSITLTIPFVKAGFGQVNS